MKLAAAFVLAAALAGAGTAFASNALPVDTTPTAAQFARALTGATNQVSNGRSIKNTHCVKGDPGEYMCAYTVVKRTGSECHLMQGLWTPQKASSITVTLAGRVGRCDSVRDAILSLG
jgi:hypothetical protein